MTRYHCPRSNWTGPESELRRGICPGCAGTTLYEDCSVRRVDERRPLPPDVLANALQDRIHPTSGRLLRARPIKRSGETMTRELDALRALEARLRAVTMRMPYPLRDDVLDLLKAIDEARK